MSPFAPLLLVALLGVTAVRVGLCRRQMRHLQDHGGEVPPAFQGRLTADEHGRASDYPRARLRLDRVKALAGAVLLVALTGGGW
ncbi:hypothetical protein [Thiohalorhabdus sp.]|uniref:hypothetical protein n=1 Tax=Thiohalorhabdus sp. TaxID=3094134 RepID=UPI002FC30779